MRIFGFLALASLVMASCVPIKKYQELEEKEKICSEELAAYKNNALNYEADAKDFKSKFELANKERLALAKDTTELRMEYNTLLAKYDKLAAINNALETNYDALRLSGARDVAGLNADLEARKKELQKREAELLAMENNLKEQENRIRIQQEELAALNKMIEEQEAASKALKEKVAHALRGFENKGLKVEEKNGKIYVSLEAKLLFASGSTSVQSEGKTALVELAKVLESEKELEIIVEGHTDSDKMSRSSHPSNNWELSVLRSTSVIEIMTLNSQLDPKQLMAAGRSQFHPIDASDKSKNRRIEIIISPNLDELYNLISE